MPEKDKLVPALRAQEAPREPCGNIAPGWKAKMSCVNPKGHSGNHEDSVRCWWRNYSIPAEPQAGAQVPSQELCPYCRKPIIDQPEEGGYTHRDSADAIACPNKFPNPEPSQDARMPANWFEDSSLETWFPFTAEELTRLKAHLATIRSYAVEAAKTPITRESILAAPQVDDAPIPADLKPLRDALIAKSQGRGGTYLAMSEYQCIDLIGLVARLTAQLEARKLTELAQYDELQGFCRLVLSEIGGGK